MKKEEYVKIINKKVNNNAKEIMLKQLNNYYEAKGFEIPKRKYNIGDEVLLEKGTLLYGTYKNIEGLKEILKDGLLSSWFIGGRLSKYPSSVAVWNLKQEIYKRQKK